MPPMCVSDAVVDEARVKLIRASWDRITNGQTSVLEEDKEENPLSSSATYFYTYFYDRLFAIDPSSKALFGNMQSQGTRTCADRINHSNQLTCNHDCVRTFPVPL